MEVPGQGTTTPARHGSPAAHTLSTPSEHDASSPETGARSAGCCDAVGTDRRAEAPAAPVAAARGPFGAAVARPAALAMERAVRTRSHWRQAVRRQAVRR